MVRLGPAGRTKWSRCSDHHGPTPQDVPAVAFTGTTCSDYLTFQSLLLQSCVFGIYREIWMCRVKLQRVRIWICFSPLKAGGCPPPHHHALLAWFRRRSQQTSRFNFDVNFISSHYISLYTLLYISTCFHTPFAPWLLVPSSKHQVVLHVSISACPATPCLAFLRRRLHIHQSFSRFVNGHLPMDLPSDIGATVSETQGLWTMRTMTTATATMIGSLGRTASVDNHDVDDKRSAMEMI